MKHLYCARMKLNGKNNKLYFIVSSKNLGKKQNHYFRIASTNDGVVEIDVDQLEYEFITSETNTINRFFDSNIIKNLLYIEKFLKK